MKNEYINKNGMDMRTGLYISRYYAKKVARGDEMVVKVDGGYKIMTAINYYVWRNQH
jgi:hypothetical protein